MWGRWECFVECNFLKVSLELFQTQEDDELWVKESGVQVFFFFFLFVSIENMLYYTNRERERERECTFAREREREALLVVFFHFSFRDGPQWRPQKEGRGYRSSNHFLMLGGPICKFGCKAIKLTINVSPFGGCSCPSCLLVGFWIIYWQSLSYVLCLVAESQPWLKICSVI